MVDPNRSTTSKTPKATKGTPAEQAGVQTKEQTKAATGKNIEDIFRLTEVQEALLAHHASAGGGVLAQRVELMGELRPKSFEAAWRRTVQRHPVLRASVHWRKLKHPVQVVAKQMTVVMPFVDLRRTLDDGTADLDQQIADFCRQELDPSRAPTWRLGLWRVGDHKHVLVWSCHHLLLDGWSCLTVLNEVVAGHNARMAKGVEASTDDRTLRPLTRFRDVVVWSRGPKSRPAEQFWSSQGLAARDFLTTPRLTTAEPSARTSAKAAWTGQADQSLEPILGGEARPLDLGRLGSRARELGVTVGSLLVGCWALTLAQVTRSEHAALGFVASGRSAPALEFPHIDGLVGMLSNAMPFSMAIARDSPVQDFFRSVMQRQQEIQSFEHLPLNRLFEAGGVSLKRAPFDTLLAFANYPIGAEKSEAEPGSGPTDDPSELVLDRFSGDLTSGYPLTLAFQPGAELRLRVLFASQLLPRPTVEALVERFESLLMAVLRPQRETTDGPATETTTVEDLFRRALEEVPEDGRLARLQVDPSRRGSPQTAEPGRRPRGGTGAEAPRTATEAQVMRLWNDLIAIQEFSPDDNFFELGGHSLLVPALVQRIQTNFGVELPLGLIYQNATVRALAGAIDGALEGGRGPRWSSLVPIRPRGSRRPLFLVHGLGGEVGWFYDLANYLDPELPLYGLQAPPDPHHRLEAMADHYVAEVCRLDPTGPYRLGGYCVGGGIAFEMARRLSRAGKQVEWVVLIDSVPQAHAQQLGGGGPKALARRMRRLFSKPPSEMVASVSDAARRATQRVSSRLKTPDPRRRSDSIAGTEPQGTEPQGTEPQGATLELDDVLDMRSLPKVYHQAARRHFAAMRDYAPGPYEGDVQLLRTDDPRFDEDFGWGEWVRGTLTVDRIPGRHADVLKEPHVAVVGAKLGAALARLDDGGVP